VAVKIRLLRVGKAKQPSYRIVVADGRSPRDGRIIETIGHYGPRGEPSRVDVDGDRALAWLRKGAQPTEQVQKLLAVAGVWGTYEAEKRGPIDTKLNRRRFVTGRGATPKREAAPPAPTPAAAAEPEPAAADAEPAPAEPEPEAAAPAPDADPAPEEPSG
jgi:small subunit ribosomal protein S16